MALGLCTTGGTFFTSIGAALTEGYNLLSDDASRSYDVDPEYCIVRNGVGVHRQVVSDESERTHLARPDEVLEFVEDFVGDVNDWTPPEEVQHDDAIEDMVASYDLDNETSDRLADIVRDRRISEIRNGRARRSMGFHTSSSDVAMFTRGRLLDGSVAAQANVLSDFRLNVQPPAVHRRRQPSNWQVNLGRRDGFRTVSRYLTSEGGNQVVRTIRA